MCLLFRLWFELFLKVLTQFCLKSVNKYENVDLSTGEDWRKPSPAPERGRARIDLIAKSPPVPKRRSASRSPPRRGIKKGALINRQDLTERDEEDYYVNNESFQQTWKSLPQRSDEDEDYDGESLKKILQNAQSFKSPRFNHQNSQVSSVREMNPAETGRPLSWLLIIFVQLHVFFCFICHLSFRVEITLD